jgi:hypothetical protein
MWHHVAGPSNVAAGGLLIFTTIFFSLIQDVDLRRSKVRDVVSTGLAFAMALTYIYFNPATWWWGPIFFLALHTVFQAIPTRHRGLLHSFRFSLAVSAGVMGVVYFLFTLSRTHLLLWFGLVFATYSLHLLLDRL